MIVSSVNAGAGKLGIIVIGRNEGERLRRCLDSVREYPTKVYVDSGSTDASVVLARSLEFQVVELRTPPNFTAARARNAGLARLLQKRADLSYVQMVDGDCEVQPGWIGAALLALEAEPDLALVYGRRRERFPEQSIYNALCDDEWNTPVGETNGCGGDAMFRIQALQEVGFYNPAMIAGEDTELAMRLMKSGWRLRRLDAEMTVHDAAISRFSQWWSRTRRSGHGYGEMAFLHPDARNPNWPRTVRSIAFWGLLMPLGLVGAVALGCTVGLGGWLVAGLFAACWPLRMAQLAERQRRRGLGAKVAWASGVLLIVGKVPQFLGLVHFHWNRLVGRASRLIEYKGPKAA